MSDFFGDVMAELRSILARLQDIDFWPPWDLAGEIVDLVASAVNVAVNPPDPSPDAVEDARAAWRQVDQRTDGAVDDLEAVPGAVPVSTWEGESASAFRSSVREARQRIATIAEATAAIDPALVTLGEAMGEARAKHADARARLTPHLSISWGNLTPWGLVDLLRGIVGDVIAAVEDLIGAYEDAAAALTTADQVVRTAVDGIELPTRLPGGVSPVDVVNAWDDDRGPLGGSTLEAYDDAYAALTPQQRAEIDAALAAADSDLERAYILQAVASGMSGTTLANYVDHLATMTRDEIEDLDPLEHATRTYDPTTGEYTSPYEQPDSTTCGSSTLVMSRMLNDPAYALWMETGYDPATGQTDGRTPAERFADEALAMHDRTNGLLDRDGNPQLPYPQQIGTWPWNLANEMNAGEGSGVPGAEYGVDIVDPDRPDSTYDAIQHASEDGHAVPFYVGDDHIARHIVLVTGTDGDDLEIYDPASGDTYTVTRQQFTDGELGVAGWDQAWFGVVPTG